jgi:predicted transcriptional regulator YdeE
MSHKILTIPAKKLVGISIVTDNASEFNLDTAKIGATVGKYFASGMANLIPNRVNPGITICAYTNYEDKHFGKYTYFIGEEVSEIDNLPRGYVSLVIPEQTYAKFTTDLGNKVEVCIATWQKIWSMTAEDFGGGRSYAVDFEVYDERAANPENAVMDIYIGIDSNI